MRKKLNIISILKVKKMKNQQRDLEEIVNEVENNPNRIMMIQELSKEII